MSIDPPSILPEIQHVYYCTTYVFTIYTPVQGMQPALYRGEPKLKSPGRVSTLLILKQLKLPNGPQRSIETEGS
jgi:hypothetical protein